MSTFISRLLLLSLLIGCATSYAQELKYFVSKDATEFAPEIWEAKWISIPEMTYEDKNHVMLARKSFVIKEKLSEARLFITAESHYELWINGKYVTQVPTAPTNPDRYCHNTTA
jgi:hypothetical protein